MASNSATPAAKTSASETTASATTLREDLVTLLTSMWMVGGLFIDGYAHINIIDTRTEDFFTPWHAILYSGYLATASWIGWLALRRFDDRPWYRWFPTGYGWAAVGVAVFAIGGVGDGIWHTVFGIETSLDALLSPSHLLLLAGFMLIVTAPLRAARRPTNPVAHGWLATLSLTLAMAVVGFFTAYANPLDSGWFFSVDYVPETGSNWTITELALSGSLFTTVMLTIPALFLQRRYQLGIGAVALLWAGPILFVTSAFGGGRFAATVATAVGGLIVDLIRGRSGQRAGQWMPAILGVGIAAIWSLFLLLEHLDGDPVVWLPELWSGLIVLNTLLAVFLAVLTASPRLNVDDTQGSAGDTASAAKIDEGSATVG